MLPVAAGAPSDCPAVIDADLGATAINPAASAKVARNSCDMPEPCSCRRSITNQKLIRGHCALVTACPISIDCVGAKPVARWQADIAWLALEPLAIHPPLETHRFGAIGR